MKHGMAVRAHRTKVLERVQLVVRPQLGDRDNVMHMDKARAEGSVSFFET
jgi:hypothetical protein